MPRDYHVMGHWGLLPDLIQRKRVVNTTERAEVLSYLIPATTLRPGSCYRMIVRGELSIGTGTAPNLEISLDVEGQIWVVALLVSAANQVNKPWRAEFTLLIRSLESSGVAAVGTLVHNDAASTFAEQLKLSRMIEKPINTATDTPVRIMVGWSVASPSADAYCDLATVEVVKS